MIDNKLSLGKLQVENIRELGMLPEQRLLTTSWEYKHFLNNTENQEYIDFIKKFKELKTGKDLEGIRKITPLNPYGEITENDWIELKKRVLFITLHITRLCNSNCNICFYEREAIETNEIDLRDIKYLISKIGKGKRVVISGGEPTVRKDLFEIIKEINNSRNYPELYTNGLKLADEGYVKKLKENNVRKVHISFDGFGEEVYEKLRGDGNQYYTKLKALKNLENYRIPTNLCSVIANGINDDQIPKLLEFVVKSVQNQGSIRGINFFSATPYGKFDIKVGKLLTELDIIKILEKVPFAEINREYILEFEKFKRNINKFLKIFGFQFPVMAGFTPKYKVEGGKIKEMFPLRDLREMNCLLDKRKFLSFFLNICKYKEVWPFMRSLFDLGRLADVMYESDNLLSIRINLVRTPNMPEKDYDEYSVATLCKNNKGKIVLISGL